MQYDIYPPIKLKFNLVDLLFNSIRNFLAILGLLLLAGLFYLYFHGYQVADSFNNEFVGFFGKFIEQVLQQDVASAMLIKTKLKQDVTIKQASDAMKKYANQVNIKLVNSHLLYKETDHKFIKIFEFSDFGTTALLEHNPDFAAYLPYKIAMYKDNNKQVWLAILDISSLLQGRKNIEPVVKMQVLKIQEDLLKIMNFGAYGIEY